MKKHKKIILLLSLLFLFPVSSVLARTYCDCGNVTGIPKKIPEITSYIMTIVQIAVPVILVVIGSIDFIKGITSQKEDELNKNQKIFVKRLIIAVLIFFIIVIVKFLISLVADSSGDNISECIDCFLNGKCKNCSEISSTTGESTSGSSSNPGANVKPNLGTNTDPIIVPNIGESNSSSNSSSNSGSNSKAEKNILIGDSRTVQMCGAMLNIDARLCSYDTNGAKVDGNDTYVSQGSMSYNWFISTALPYVNSKISSEKHNIIILMGVNDGLTSSANGKSAADKYYNKVSELATTTWKNHNVIFVSVNPVRETKNHYAKVAGVDAFNKEMKSKIDSSKISNLKYCDTASSISASTSNSSDGLHYNSSTNKKIHDIIINNCL